VQSWAYDTTRNLIDYVENKVGTTTVSKYGCTNDSTGRRTSVQKSGTAFSQTDTVTWTYDDRSQVTDAVASNDANYDYDPIGNRTSSATRETGTAVTSTYTANQLNQYTAITGRTSPAYDDDGNMTLLPDAGGDWTLGWNGENRLVTAEFSSAKLEFLYDHMGRRVEKKTYTGTTGNWTLSETRRFLYDGWDLITEFTVAGETVSLDRTHVWGLDLSWSLLGAGGVGGLLRTTEHGGTTNDHYPTYDANGNVSEYLDSTGGTVAHYEYSPFGRGTTATGTKAADFPFRFSTKYLGALTSMYCCDGHYYAPSVGRTLTRNLSLMNSRGRGSRHSLLSLFHGSYASGPSSSSYLGISEEFLEGMGTQRNSTCGWARCDRIEGKVKHKVTCYDPTSCFLIHEAMHIDQLASCCSRVRKCRGKAIQKGDQNGVHDCALAYYWYEKPKKDQPGFEECMALKGEKLCLEDYRKTCEDPGKACPHGEGKCNGSKGQLEQVEDLMKTYCDASVGQKICPFDANGELPKK